MRPLSEETALLRTAIEMVLTEANGRPMTANEVAEHYEVAALGADANTISKTLYVMHKNRSHPIKRVPYTGPGVTRWAYFLPTEPEVVNGVNSGPAPADPTDFQFNPVEFTGETGAAKAITLSVAGVTIRIELSQ